MMRVLSVLAVLLSGAAARHHQHQRSLFEIRRPECAREQTCSYEVAGMGIPFTFCDCPGSMACPKGNELAHKGTNYQFCAPWSPPVCESGDVSVVVEGIQTAIQCICGDEFRLEKAAAAGLTAQFICVPVL